MDTATTGLPGISVSAANTFHALSLQVRLKYRLLCCDREGASWADGFVAWTLVQCTQR